MIFYYTFYQVHRNITSSSSLPTYFHSEFPGNEFPLTGCLVHYLLHQSFSEKNLGANVKNEFLMTFDIAVILYAFNRF